MNRNTGYRVSVLIMLLSIGSLFSASAEAQALTPDQLTLQMKTLNARSQKSASSLAEVQKNMNNLQQEVSKVGRLVDNRGMLEMLQRLDELSDEVSQLRGEIEQQGHDIGGIKKRQRELYLDIDRRLRDLENRTSQPSNNAQIPLPVAPPKPEVPAVDVTISTNGSSATNTVEPVQSTVASTQNSQPVSATSSAEQAAYQAAFDTLKEGRYKKAKTELKSFLKKYPNSSFAGNAQYWLGEANYVTRHFEQGVTEFKKVLTRFPGGSKVPDAMLKLGYTYYELKDYNQSKLLLQDLRKRFPKTTAFRLAGKRLERIQKEGH